LIVICMTRDALKIRTYPDFSLRIHGFLIGRRLYIQVRRWVMASI
jgi:hypothetical protein